MGKQVLGYILIGVAIVATIFAPAGMGYWAKIAYFGAAMAMSVGGSMLLNQVAKKEMAEQLARAQSVTAGLQANTRTSQAPIPAIYGWQKIGGNYLYMKAVGSNNNELHCVLGLCEGEIGGIEKMYFGDTLVWDRTGALKTSYFFNFTIDYRLGTSSQSYFSQVNAIDADFEDTYPNTAVVYLKLIYDQNLWQGVPQVKFIIRGRKVYDPRDTTTKWTQNGVLQFRDIMTNQRFAAGIPETKMDDIAIGEAANYADQVVTRTTPLDVSEFLRYGWGDLHSDVMYSWTGTHTVYWGNVCPGTLSIGGVGYDDGAGNITGGGFAGTINYETNLLTITSAPGFPDENCWAITFRDGWYHMDDYLQYAPVVPGSVSFSSAEETVSDNGLGVLTGSLGGSGTIDYTTGRMIFNWKLAPPRYDPINVAYQTGSGPRFLTNYFAIDGGSVLDSIRSLLSQFRGYLVYSGGYYAVKIDKPETTVAAFQSGGDEDGTNNIIDGSFSWQVPGISEIPTRVRAKWIDPMENWAVKDYIVDLPGIDSDRRELTLELYSCTNIDVVERIARTHAALIGSSIRCMFKTNLQGLILEPGSKVTVTHPAAAWTDKEFRVVEISDVIASETVSLSLIEYAATNYIDDPQTTSIIGDGISPGTHPYGPPPNVTGLTLTEFWRQLKDGTWSSWIRVTFAEPSNYPYTAAYEVYLRDCSSGSNQYVMYGETRSGVYEIGPVKEGVLWGVMIVIRTINGVRFFPSGAFGYINPTGKVGLPTAPAFVTATCTFTDRVVLNWAAIADTDLGNYELRTDLNWGNATNRLYLGKGTSFWMQAAAASYTVYLKTIDTSGNYSLNYVTKTLTNGAPTAPSVTTDYIGRDCIVKWGASPDLDFSKWVLTIYSDAGRTTLKRTVEVQSPGFTYTYDQIRADFGGAGVPGTIYFRLVTHDIFGSTTTTDFSATQASPAIVQYDGGSVERVRIGDLGSGAYGARFKDSGGNITFEQGDTLKQKYMKLDDMVMLKISRDLRAPFTESTFTAAVQTGSYDGTIIVFMDNGSYTSLRVGAVDYNLGVTKALFVAETATYAIESCCGNFEPTSFVNLYWNEVSGGNGGLYYKQYSFSAWGVNTAKTLVQAQSVRSHNNLMQVGNFGALVFMGNSTDLYYCRVSGAGAFSCNPAVIASNAGSGFPIRPVGGYTGSTSHVLYRDEVTRNLYYVGCSTTNGSVTSGPTQIGASIGTGSYVPSAVILEMSETPANQRWILYCPNGTKTTISIIGGDGVVYALGDYAWSTKALFSTLNYCQAQSYYGNDLGAVVPFLCLGNTHMFGPGNDQRLAFANFSYRRRTSANMSNNLMEIGIV